MYPLKGQGCQTHFHWGHISLTVAFKGLDVILGLYTRNYSLSRGKELGSCRRVEMQAGTKQGGGPDSARGLCVCHL